MALTPFPRVKFESANPVLAEAVENITERLSLVERTSLEEMAGTIDSKTTKEGVGRIVETMFRRGFTHPDKLKVKPKDILATLIEQEVARKFYHEGTDFASSEGKRELAKIEEAVKALLPKSETEGRAVIDCMKRFDAAIQEALDNEDETRSPELWQAVQDYYTHVDRALSAPLEKKCTEDEIAAGIPRAPLPGHHIAPRAIPNERREATLTLLRGQLLGRVRELFDPRDPDGEEKQKKFVEMFEHTELLDGLTKKDMPVHPSWLAHNGIQHKVLALLSDQQRSGIEPRVEKALSLGVVEPQYMPMHLAEPALVRTAGQIASEENSFEWLVHALSHKGVPPRSYTEVVANPRAKEQTMLTMRGMLEQGSTFSEWLNGIAQFDAFVKNRALEPFAALPDTPGDPDAEAKKEIQVTIPAALSSLQQELDATVKLRDEADEKLKEIKSDRAIKKEEEKLEKLDHRIEELKNNIKTLTEKYGPSAREALFSPYRRLSKADLEDTILHPETRKKQLERLINLFENGHDTDFVRFRDKELLKERGGDTYWQYRILQDSDLLHPRFVEYIERIAVERLSGLSADLALQKQLRKFFVDNGIVSDAVLLSYGV